MSSGGDGGRGPSTQFALGGMQAEPGELNTDNARTGLLNLKTATTVAQLLIVGGPGAGQKLGITEGRNTVGRGEANDLVLNFGDPAVGGGPPPARGALPRPAPRHGCSGR